MMNGYWYLKYYCQIPDILMDILLMLEPECTA
jgi:hypothetical protein